MYHFLPSAVLVAIYFGALVSPAHSAKPLSPVEVAKKAKATMAYLSPSSASSSRSSSRGFGGRFNRGGVDRGRSFRGALRGGTAICIHPSGLFLTNYRTIAGFQNDKVRLHIRQGQKEEKIISGQIVRKDEKQDLALVWSSEAKDLPVLPLANGKQPLQEVITCGPPINSGRSGSPALIFQRNKIVAGKKPLPKSTSMLQLREQPHTQGGAVLDQQGRLAGMLFSPETTVEPLAISVEQIRKFLKGPVVQVLYPDLNVENLHKPFAFRVQMASMASDDKLPSGTLELVLQSPGDAAPRRIKLTSANGIHTATTAPVPAPKVPPLWNIEVTFKDGRLQGKVKDQSLTVLDKPVKLSTIREIRSQGEEAVVTFTDRQRSTMAARLLPSLTVLVAGQRWPVALKDAVRAEITPPTPLPYLECKLVSKANGKETRLWEKTLPIDAPRSSRFRGSFADVRRQATLTMARYDANGNGSLEVTEIPRSLQSADRNGDGSVSLSELANYLQRSSSRSGRSRFGGFDRNVQRPFGRGGAPGRR